MESIHSKKGTQGNRKLLFVGVIFICIVVLVVLVRYFSLFWGLTVDKKINVKKTSSGNINVLIMGIGGANHDGPNLTDTIILASVNPEKNSVHMISIPRDLYVDTIEGKINRVYSDGQEKGGKGILLSSVVMNSITGIRPDYVVVIDFSGFEKLIDLLGGIDVDVVNTLDDYAYPLVGKEDELCGVTEDGMASFSAQIATSSATDFDIFPCRFEHVHVDEGMQHMDGKLALKFARSRHGVGSEGSDFARSRRQQLVISAIRNKILSLGTLANPVKVVGMINLLKDNIKTNIQEKEYDDFIKLAQKMKGAKITSSVIEEGNPGDARYGLLINPPLQDYRGQWVLAPRAGKGNYTELKEYVACVFSGNDCEVIESGIEKKVSPTVTKTP